MNPPESCWVPAAGTHSPQTTPSARILFGAWLGAFLLTSASAAGADTFLQKGPICFPLASEVATLSTNRSKIGFLEFPGYESVPPKFFLKNRIESKRDYTYSFFASWEYFSSRYLFEDQWDTITYDPSKSFHLPGPNRNICWPMDAPATTSCYGVFSHVGDGAYRVRSSFNDQTQREASPPGAWANQSYVDMANHTWRLVDESLNREEPSSTPLTNTKSEYRFIYSPPSYQCTKTLIEERSAEYTTAELLSRTQGDLDALQAFPAWGFGVGLARTEASSGEECLTQFQKLKYRLKFLPEKDEQYEFTYTERFVADDGWAVDLATYTVRGVGTGKLLYYPSPAGKVVQPPRFFKGARLRNGSIGLVLPKSEACNPCGEGEFTVANRSVDVRMNLGRGAFGEAAGWLVLKEERPAWALFSPAALQFLGRGQGVEVIRNATGLRQLKTLQMLADLVTLAPTRYEIRCYRQAGPKGGNGLYAPVGPAFTSATIESVNQSMNQLRLSIRNGTLQVYEFVWSEAEQGWTLSCGGGLRQESSAWNQAALTETRAIKDSGNRVVYQETRKYARFAEPIGLLLTERQVGSAGSALITQRFYYDQPGIDGLNYGALKLEIQPNGAWERYEYDAYGRRTKIIGQFLNGPINAAADLCRVTEFGYAPVDPVDDGTQWTNCPRTTIQKLLGQEIGRQYLVVSFAGEWRQIQCQTPRARPDSPDNRVTVKRYLPASLQTDELQSQKNPDGTLALYKRTVNPEGTQTTSVSVGQSNPDQTAILTGTRTVTLVGPVGQLISRTVSDITSGLVLSRELYSQFDALNRPQRVSYLDGTFSEENYGCCGLESARDREGTLTQYSYDALKRLTGFSRHGITTSYLLDANGSVLEIRRQGTDNSVQVLQRTAYDLAGRPVTQTNALGGVTRYTEGVNAQGLRLKTTVYPDGGTRLETCYQDGSLERLTGTAIPPFRYLYGVELRAGQWRAYTKEIKLAAAGQDTPQWTASYTDMAGRTDQIVYAAAAAPYPCQQSFYNPQGQLAKQIDPDGFITLYQYDQQGQLEFSALDLNGNGQIDLAGPDRLSRTVTDVLAKGSVPVRRTRTYVYPENGSDRSLLVGTLETSADGLKVWQTTWNGGEALTRQIETRYDAARGYRYLTQTAPDGSQETSLYQFGRLQSLTRKDATGTLLGQTTYQYDPHGQLGQVSDARNGATSFAYNAADLVIRRTTPAPSLGQSPQTTATEYDSMGRPRKILYPNQTSLNHEYHLSGQLKRTWGAGAYPVGYSYDVQGRLTQMTHWTRMNTVTGIRITTWNYHPYRGWLDNKRYPDGTGPDFTYTPAGRLKCRLWARGNPRLLTTYAYNPAGELVTLTYADGTPSVAYTYDRRGCPQTITRAGTTTTFTYNEAGQLLSESYSGGTLNRLAVQSRYDLFQRRTQLQAMLNPLPVSSGASPAAQAATLASVTYGYDPASRLQSVAEGIHGATYTYLANSAQIQQTDLRLNGTVRMRVNQQYDALDRLVAISSVASATGILPVSGTGILPVSNPIDLPSFSFSYQYNSAQQRSRMGLADGSFWVYEYDALGQVKSAKRYWPEGVPVAGQQFEYAFDEIGNRTSTGGRASAQSQYSANSLNQYTSRTVPGAVDFLGIAHAESAVKVNGQSANRRGEFFHQAVILDNRTGPVYAEVEVSAALGSQVNRQRGRVYAARTPEVCVYDQDGNLVRDGRWTYRWDGENRLVGMETLAEAPAGSGCKLEFEYDDRGRRIAKKAYTGFAGLWRLAQAQKYLYDLPAGQTGGWNLMAILNSDNSLQTSFLWGLDLSGSLAGAGGVGGLLAVKDAAKGVHFAVYDGNGNVAALVQGTDGTVSARYEYGPFGELLRATGPMASANPFRFSTKFTDAETDLLYYGYRYYQPGTGRWISRDLIEERGGLNLYGFIENSPANRIDTLGLWASLLGMHCNLTIESFILAEPSLKASVPEDPFVLSHPCRYNIIAILQRANDLQDSGVGFAANERHYNRDYVSHETSTQRESNRSDWRTRFSSYVSTELSAYNSEMAKSRPNCREALRTLGRLSHTWQDFYAHGIHSSGGWRGSPSPFPATPESTGEYWPSTYGSWWAEHPNWSEPSYGGSERKLRWDAAVRFVSEQYIRLLPHWLKKCGCECDWML